MRGILRAAGFACVASLALLLFTGCNTLPPMRPVNLAEPGWVIQQGQALWQTKSDSPEIGGEVLFAKHPDGRTVLQFSKNPIPIVNVQTSNTLWQVEFIPERRKFSGKGSPTPRLMWVHLARAFAGEKPRDPMKFESSPNEFTFENKSSGEKISGFLQ
jgi:hypothetical protein